MQNWIGIAIWIVMGAVIGLSMKALIARPEETPGHTPVLAVLGAFASVIGGMLGVGTFHLDEPLAISPGGMAGAAIFAAMMTFVYRWGLRALI
jgi:small basic protein